MIRMVDLYGQYLSVKDEIDAATDTTARIQGPGMGLAGFATMLFSMLSFMCFLNAFPYRKKPNIPMVVLMFAMLGIVIFADAYYINAVLTAVTRAENPIVVTDSTIYIMYAEWYLDRKSVV